jgi:hypothetical protein
VRKSNASKAEQGKAAQGKASPAKQGRAQQGMAPHRNVKQRQYCRAWQCTAAKRKATPAKQGNAWHRNASKAGQCMATQGIFSRDLTMNVYNFRPGRSIKNVNPQAVGQELERIRSEHDTLTADLVLSVAESQDSPLHDAFEWDDSIAARKHRLDQARRLIVSVRVINSPVQTPVPAYVSVRSPDKGRQYLPTTEALSNDELRARVLDEIKQFSESLQRRYAYFAEAADLLAKLKAATA